MSLENGFYLAFALIVSVLLAADLGLFRRKSRDVAMREALIWSGVWISAALLFNVAIYLWRGSDTALQFLTGYLIELSLSVDNLFVFLLLFGQFSVPSALQHRVLFWGIAGAIVMRVAMILAGAALITQFHWILYLFGIFLLVTGVRMLLHSKDSETSPADHPLMNWLRRHLPVSATQPADGRFFTRENGKRLVTPLFIVLIAVELTDLMFAVDSVPAIFAVTTDVFVVITSNIFAILGLRSLYFALRGLASRLHYLKHGLAAILMLIGAKILLADIYPIPIAVALGGTAFILTVAVAASLLRKQPDPA